MSLLTNLISYWALNEASGTRFDSHAANDLTDNGATGSTTGKINSCASFSGGTQYLTHLDNAALSVGATDFTFSLWVKDSDPNINVNNAFLYKFDSSGSEEYRLTKANSYDVRFFVCSGPSPPYLNQDFVAQTGFIVANTWYHFVFWFDGTAGTINFQVNNGTVASKSWPHSTFDGNGTFVLGNLLGLIDEVGFWKRVLTAAERTSLYNGGAGLAYSAFGGGGITGSASIALGALTCSSAGTLAIAGAASIALGALTLTSAGTLAMAQSASGANHVRRQRMDLERRRILHRCLDPRFLLDS